MHEMTAFVQPAILGTRRNDRVLSKIPLHTLLQKAIDFEGRFSTTRCARKPKLCVATIGIEVLKLPLLPMDLLESIIKIIYEIEINECNVLTVDSKETLHKFLNLLHEALRRETIRFVDFSEESLFHLWMILPLFLEEFLLEFVQMSKGKKDDELQDILQNSCLAQICIKEPKLLQNVVKIMVSMLLETGGHSTLFHIVQSFVKHVKDQVQPCLAIQLYPTKLQPLAIVMDSYCVISDERSKLLSHALAMLIHRMTTKTISSDELMFLVLLHPEFYRAIIILAKQTVKEAEEARILLSVLWNVSKEKIGTMLNTVILP